MLRALRAAARNERLQGRGQLDPIDIEVAISSGLGPLLFHLLSIDGPEEPLSQRLQAAYLTSRVLTAELLQNVEHAVALLNDVGIPVTLLKGISYATRYYAAPHLRIMGDVDFLLPASLNERAAGTLLDAGFVRPEPPPGIDWPKHIHSPGLYHPERRFWIELHRKLVPDSFAACDEAPLNLCELPEHELEGRLGGQAVRQLSSEFELVYLAVGWCRDLTVGCGDPGLRRMLFDFVALLRASEALDWNRLLAWSRNSLTGACIYIVYAYLVDRDVIDDAARVLPRLRAAQSFVNSVSLKLIHRQIDRYIVRMQNFGPVRSSSNVTSALHALIARRPAWRNVMAVPGNILLPPGERRRFEWRYQLRRMGSVFRPR